MQHFFFFYGEALTLPAHANPAPHAALIFSGLLANNPKVTHEANSLDCFAHRFLQARKGEC